MNKSKDYPNPASNRDGDIAIYDSAFEIPRDLGRVLAHELAHLKYLSLSTKEREDYAWATGWYVIASAKSDRDPEKYIRRKNGYVKPDGDLFPEEDFSNNIEYYLFKPKTLKKVTPNAYNWIHKHFGANFKLER